MIGSCRLCGACWSDGEFTEGCRACGEDAMDRPATEPAARICVVTGDLLDQDVDVIVNSWNRNIFPWWMLILQGVSGAIKRRAGTAPFREIARTGALPLGHARLTSAGELPHRGIIHVASIDLLWRSNEQAIRDCARNAMAIVHREGFSSVGFPLLGAGTGGFGEQGALAVLEAELRSIPSAAEIRIVLFRD